MLHADRSMDVCAECAFVRRCPPDLRWIRRNENECRRCGTSVARASERRSSAASSLPLHPQHVGRYAGAREELEPQALFAAQLVARPFYLDESIPVGSEEQCKVGKSRTRLFEVVEHVVEDRRP